MPYPALDEKVRVAPQISPADVAELAAGGVRLVICNRPDAEVPTELAAASIKAACNDAGISFVENPLSHGNLTLDIVDRQRDAIESAQGPVLAYCASGNRSTILWSLAEAKSGTMTTDEILTAATRAGYNIGGLAPQLDALIGKRG